MIPQVNQRSGCAAPDFSSCGFAFVLGYEGLRPSRSPEFIGKMKDGNRLGLRSPDPRGG